MLNKLTINKIACTLALIYQSYIGAGKVPCDWKDADVLPIFKKDVQYDPANYRHVSLTGVCCKVLEHILTSTVKSHLESHQILCPQQQCFKTRHHARPNLMDTQMSFSTTYGLGKADNLIMGFMKAFD